MSTAFITFGLLAAALKLVAESMELFVKTSDLAKRPKSTKRLLEAKAILNVAAAISAVVALVAPFFGPSEMALAIVVTLATLLVFTLIIALLVWRETPESEIEEAAALENAVEGGLPD